MECKTDLDKLRHSCSHIMAQAVQEIWPETKVTIGPAIENGFYYDFDKKEPFSDQDLRKIEKRMRKIIERKPAFKQTFMPRLEAISFFKEKEQPYKVELIENLEDDQVSIYHTGEEWLDLCKGPHIENAGTIKAFKLLSVAGAYWRGDVNRPQLQRIYGTAFFSQEELDAHLKLLEEAQKRDHRKLGPQLDLYNIYQESAGAGLIFYPPAGATLRNIIETYIREENMKRGYDLVMTPHLLRGKLWDQSGHSGHYRENMYYLDIDNEEYAVKPMNCPGHNLIYNSKVRSYRELPIRFFELGTVYRQEKAGVLHGLLRVRGFTQDDAHIYCREDQLKDEIKSVIDFVFSISNDFGFKDIQIELSTQPENFIGEQKNWDHATKVLKQSLEEKNINFKINEGDGAFYGPKIDFKLRDALNREWQCATIQCDFSLPERFDLVYVNEEGNRVRPIMIHRAILGSVERFIGTLIEHYAGAFPLWLAPTQIMVIPINDDQVAFAQSIKENLQNKKFRVIIDQRNESLGKKIREGTIKKIPYLIIIGDKEAQEQKVSVRTYAAQDTTEQFSINELIERMLTEIKDKK
ncbi:MAG: threonine--tRNA ligase [Candidatus Omnitrophica bacterium]|nr:threonine--tRNA ligase [Candidatus Omnitrophota bacterium]